MSQGSEEPTQSDDLTPSQLHAARPSGRDVFLTAGAGSGKTRTLVARYMTYLEEGRSPRDLMAITFTEKAAREMRNRIRAQVAQRAREADSGQDRRWWTDVEATMDAARIGTIHSLCAEILRAHPAEAGIDPEFEVLEEGTSAVLKAQAVEEAVTWALGEPAIASLFASFTIRALELVLGNLLQRRLDAVSLFSMENSEGRARLAISLALGRYVDDARVRNAINSLASMRADGSLARDAGEKLTAQVGSLLDSWASVGEAIERGEAIRAAELLFEVRRRHMDLRAGPRVSKSKELMALLRGAYSEILAPWLGGDNAGDSPPDVESEDAAQADLIRIRALFSHALALYQAELLRRSALDFDDLENGALQLLGDPSVRERWRGAASAVLVDEFQDTNARQRGILDALSGGQPGKLLIVGDARQSIYRFRGADVTVFRKLEQDVAARGGEIVELDRTFRAHPDLLKVLDGTVGIVMGTSEGGPPYRVPYRELVSERSTPSGVDSPYFEFILGKGDRSSEGRRRAAAATVRRLLELREKNEIRDWDQVVLLFRASTGFREFEDALEEQGVPFVTVAGKGFYERPEVRDVLNMLRALADNQDDLALAGLLRSPAFGVSDASIYRLRWRGGKAYSLRQALDDGRALLGPEESERVLRVRSVLAEMEPLVDRLPVAELLKRLIDLLDLRAVLASSHSRLWRNLDKLLEDAQASGVVKVQDFLEYIETLREVGAREGEAPAEPEGAVRLMTVHRAKGLEFDFVVIADAARDPRGGYQPTILVEEVGLAVQPDRLEKIPLMYRLARWMDKERSEAEKDRLLYVAATRAKEKLIVSGHLMRNRGSWVTGGWLKDLLEATGLDAQGLAESGPGTRDVTLSNGGMIRLSVGWEELKGGAPRGEELPWPESQDGNLFGPLVVSQVSPEPEEEELSRDWRATGERLHPPAAVVGRMVHRAIQRWVFPPDPQLDKLLEASALEEGLVDLGQRRHAVSEALEHLHRLRQDALWQEVSSAMRRHHEVPYTRMGERQRVDSGVIDLLYQTTEGWNLVDFKTDRIRDETELSTAVEQYAPQLRRYAFAAKELLGIDAAPAICFLDCSGGIRTVRV